MKKLALTSLLVISLGISNSAFAESNFDGIYAGFAAGRARGEDKGIEYKDNGATFYGITQRTSPEGSLFSLFTGINKVVNENILFGAEADYEKRNYSHSNFQEVDQSLYTDYSVQTKVKNGGSLRARLGYIFNHDKTLAYVSGGYATLKVNRYYGDVSNTLGNGTLAKTHTRHEGYVGGFGLEHFVTSKVSLRAEYRYTRYNSQNVDSSVIYSAGTIEKQRLSDQSVRIGIAYNF
jgi:opacity protein-like surface antigen